MRKNELDIIRELREDSNYSQGFVAEYLGVEQQTYSCYENGKIELTVPKLLMLCTLYSVSPNYILSNDNYFKDTFESETLHGNISMNQFIRDLKRLPPQPKKAIIDLVAFFSNQKTK